MDMADMVVHWLDLAGNGNGTAIARIDWLVLAWHGWLWLTMASHGHAGYHKDLVVIARPGLLAMAGLGCPC